MMPFRGCLAVLLSALVATSVAGQEPVALKWKFTKGQSFYQELTIDNDHTLSVMGAGTPAKSKYALITRWTPLEQREDKSWIIQQKLIGLKMDTEILARKISYDSTNPAAAPKELAETMAPLIGTEFKLTLSREMKTTQVEGFDELLDKIGKTDPANKQLLASVFGEDALKEGSDALFAVLPTKAVKKGDTWTIESKLPLGPLGSFTVQRKYTCAGKAKGLDEIRMETKVLKHEPPEAKPGFRFKKMELKSAAGTGTLLFDADKGRLASATETFILDARLTAEANGMEVTLDLAQTRKLTLKTSDKDPLEKK